MKSKKMSLANIQGKLSRAEMKNIMAGSGTGNCKSSICTVYDSSTGKTYNGNCGYYNLSPGNPLTATCECVSSFGFYTPNGGTSSCWVS